MAILDDMHPDPAQFTRLDVLVTQDPLVPLLTVHADIDTIMLTWQWKCQVGGGREACCLMADNLIHAQAVY